MDVFHKLSSRFMVRIVSFSNASTWADPVVGCWTMFAAVTCRECFLFIRRCVFEDLDDRGMNDMRLFYIVFISIYIYICMYMLDLDIYIVMIKGKLISKSVSLVFHSLRVKWPNFVLVWLSYSYYWFLVTICNNIFLLGNNLFAVTSLFFAIRLPFLFTQAGRRRLAP